MISRLVIRIAAALALVGLPACGDSPPEPPDAGPEPSNVVTGVLRNNTANPNPRGHAGPGGLGVSVPGDFDRFVPVDESDVEVIIDDLAKIEFVNWT